MPTKAGKKARCQMLTPVILATGEIEVWSIEIPQASLSKYFEKHHLNP
jgi:hypothetical protein